MEKGYTLDLTPKTPPKRCSIKEWLDEKDNGWMHGPSCPECGDGPGNDMARYLYSVISRKMEEEKRGR